MNTVRLLFFILVASLASSHTWAQESEYRPFVEDGKWWVVETQYQWYVSVVEEFYINGDTIVADQPCKKLMKRTFDFDKNEYSDSLYYCMYEDGRRVYYFPKGSQQAIMLYDFGAQPGDVLTLGGFSEDLTMTREFKIVETTSLDFNGYTYNGLRADCIGLDYGDDPAFTWLESIGSDYSPFYKAPSNKYMAGQPYRFCECWVNDEQRYESIYVYGGAQYDVNFDLTINGADITALYSYLIGDKAPLLRYKAFQIRNDLNGDGVVSGADVTALYNLLLGQ